MNVKFKKDVENYNSLKSNAINALNENKIEKSLDYVYIASSYAWKVQFGKWYDDELEQLLPRIGKHIKKQVVGFKTDKSKEIQKDVKSIVHVVSFLSDVGGHSEVLRQWVNILTGLVENQRIYITNVSKTATKYSYLDDFANKGIGVRQLSHNNSYVDRIKKLIEYFEEDLPDFAILYINPNDVIAVTALQTLQNKPYVIFFNHADHVFWLGKNIIDILVEFRSNSVKYSNAFRNINRICVIPLTTDIKPRKIPKTFYGIPENSTLSVSIGGFHKLLGDPEWNYFKTIERILEQFPNHYHLLITSSHRGELEEHLTDTPNIRKRFIIDGPYPDLEPIYGVADFLIETFPYSGGMVRIEAMACGLPIVAVRNKKFEIFSESDETLPSEYRFMGFTEDQIVEYSSEFIKNTELRKQVGERLYRHFKQKMSPEKIRDLLSDLIKNRDLSIKSQPCKIKKLDFDYAYSFENYFPINRGLFFQSMMKQSEFSLKEKFNFYIESIKNRELNRKELFGGAILMLMRDEYRHKLYNVVHK